MTATDDVVTQHSPPRRSLTRKAKPTPAITRSILFQNGRSIIELAKSSKALSCLAITFAPPELCDLNGFGYYEHLLLTSGFDVLSIKQSENDGYVDLTADDIENILEGLSHYTSRIVIAANAAATAALRLCSPIPGVKILAVSPEIVLDARPAKPVQAQIFTIWDPTLLTELNNLDRITTLFSRATVIKIPHLGTPTRYSLEESGTLLKFSLALCKDASFSPRQHFRENRKLSATALFVLGDKALKTKHFQAAQTFLKRSYDIDHRQQTGIAYCQALRESGRTQAAVDFMKTIVDRQHGNAHLWAVQSYFEEMAGQPEQALASIQHAINLLPDINVFHLTERRLLNDLYGDLKLKQQMTEAALNKTRAELAMQHGANVSDFSLKKALWLGGITLFILIVTALSASIFRLV